MSRQEVLRGFNQVRIKDKWLSSCILSGTVKFSLTKDRPVSLQNSISNSKI